MSDEINQIIDRVQVKARREGLADNLTAFCARERTDVDAIREAAERLRAWNEASSLLRLRERMGIWR